MRTNRGDGLDIKNAQIRKYRLNAHSLNKKASLDGLMEVVGVCGMQNSPPGSWETALFNRIAGCTPQILREALHNQKSLLQAWSYRGVPVVFPTEQSEVFLTPLISQEGEQPWVYTRGITGALDVMQMDFDDLLPLVKYACQYLDNHIVKSKDMLDKTLADIVEHNLPKEKQLLWRLPSMYDSSGKQTNGEAVVSFMLRPCSFSSLVVFGERQNNSPTFTSFIRWIGHSPNQFKDAEKELVRKFLRAYGPSSVNDFMSWLGCSKKQAHRLWNSLADEIEPVQVEGKTRYILSKEMDNLKYPIDCGTRLLLLSAHDPYLDLKDKTVILENKALHKSVWKFSANPGVILKEGKIVGIWRGKTQKNELHISISLWEALGSSERLELKRLAEEYADFRCLNIVSFIINSI